MSEQTEELTEFQRGYVQGQRDATEARAATDAEVERYREALKAIADNTYPIESSPRAVAREALRVDDNSAR